MIEFSYGLTTMGFAAVGLFFLRFWSRSDDVFFALFAAAFWLFAVNQGVVGLLGFSDSEGLAYLLRLVGFVLIIFAIVSKNRATAAKSDRAEIAKK
jgi:Gpi18-like mannosyltransferase